MLDTKGNTLRNLENKIQYFSIPKSMIFSVSEWRNKKQYIINSIKKKFKKKLYLDHQLLLKIQKSYQRLEHSNLS